MHSTRRSSPSSRRPSRTSVMREPCCSKATGRRSAPARTSSGSARRSTCPTRRTSPTRCASTSMLEAIDCCPAPVVCCVHGFALGGGSGLVACADVAVAWPDAVFGFTEVRLGIIPAVISPFVLPKIGAAARRYFVTGERFDAAEALRIGLVSEVSEDAGERARVDPPRHPRRRADRGPRGKEARARAPDGEATAHLAAARRTSDEGQDGLRAFLERRSAAGSSRATSPCARRSVRAA